MDEMTDKSLLDSAVDGVIGSLGTTGAWIAVIIVAAIALGIRRYVRR